MSRIEEGKILENNSFSFKKAEQGHKCVFCEMINGNAPISKIKETDDSISFMALENHIIVTPKKHIDEKNIKVSAEIITDTFRLALSLVMPVKKVFQADGVNIVLNLGKSAGQEVDHLHIHVIPRNEGDRKIRFRHLEFQPRKVLDDTAKKIRKEIFTQKI